MALLHSVYSWTGHSNFSSLRVAMVLFWSIKSGQVSVLCQLFLSRNPDLVGRFQTDVAAGFVFRSGHMLLLAERSPSHRSPPSRLCRYPNSVCIASSPYYTKAGKVWPAMICKTCDSSVNDTS